MDKFDPQILYLIQPLSGGAGLRIDLHTFKLSSCKFDLKDPDNIEESIKEADKFFNSFTLIYPRVQPHPIAWEEFRGRTFSHPAFHLYGYPVASEPGLRKAEPRFGDWFIIENQNGINVELIKLPVWNSETPGDLSMGQLYISPDKRWDVFISSGRSVVFLFDRAKARSAKIE
ncbi:MAG TPA: hypothetical protein VJ623_05095 [Holophagaceae bacterium]|nr:hypothetical protein [Holophagaceae bacterium]